MNSRYSCLACSASAVQRSFNSYKLLVSLLALVMLGLVLRIISNGDKHTSFLAIGYFNGHLSLNFAINFKTIPAQSFFKFAKADITAEPSSTISMSEKFSFFPKSSCTGRKRVFASDTILHFATKDVNCLSATSNSTAKKWTTGLLAWSQNRTGLKIDAIYLKKWSSEIINLSVWYLTKESNDLLLRGLLLFDNESQYFTTWTTFSHIWIPCTAAGSFTTHLVLEKCKRKTLQPVSLI